MADKSNREELAQQIKKLQAQLSALDDAEQKEKSRKLAACVKECRKLKLHECFKYKTKYVSVNKVRVRFTRGFSSEDYYNFHAEPCIHPETDWNKLEAEIDKNIDVEAAEMEEVFSEIRKVIAEHGLSHMEKDVFQLLDPES